MHGEKSAGSVCRQEFVLRFVHARRAATLRQCLHRMLLQSLPQARGASFIFFKSCSLSAVLGLAEVSTYTTTQDASMVYEILRAHRITESDCGLALIPT